MTEQPAWTDLKQLKEAFIAAATAIDKLKEPTNDLTFIQTALLEALNTDRTATDLAFATFIYEDLGPGLAKRLSKEKSNDDTVTSFFMLQYLRIVSDIIESLIRTLAHELKHKRFNYSFYSAMALLFNHEALIFKYHYHIPDIELQKLRTHGQEWRAALNVGDMVDVFVKADERGKLCGWMQAQITQVDHDTLYLEFPLSSNIYDCKLGRWSTDIMQFETKTKQDYEWRRNTLLNGTMMECEVHDKSSWNKSTIFEIRQQTVGPNRVIPLALCALRVYRNIPNSMRKDERGTYEGWSNKFDEWVPVFCPRIQPWGTRIGVIEEEEISDDIDDLIQPSAQFKTIYAVPRPQICISELYLRCINIFGNEGCFELIRDILQSEPESDKLNITVMGSLAEMLTLPFPVYHKSFISEFGQQIADAIKQRLLVTPDQSLRDVRKEKIDAIIKSVDNISRRFLSKDEREKQSEVLRLELCNKSLRSNFLERRITGIKDLNLLIKNNTLYASSKTFTTEFLIDWMVQNDVFAAIWDHRRTHVQIVQRSNDIFKLLLKENKLNEDLLKLFWSLSKSEYQTEVLKIISESSYYLKQSQIEFFFAEVTSASPEKLTLSEFDMLCDLGKYCKVAEFQSQVSDFFWRVIVNGDAYKEELVEQAIKKFAEMVKYWDLTKKKPLLVQITAYISQSQNLVPIVRLLTKLIKEQQERGTSINVESYYQPANTQSADGDLTFTEVLNTLQSEHHLVDSLLANLQSYCAKVRKANVDPLADRRKVCVVSRYCHADEVEERLQLLKYYASICDFQFRKMQLRVIYDSLSVQSPILQDQTEFLNWCKKACQESTNKVVILDLNEVGQYFSELLLDKSLDVKTLPIAGFDFLQNYFISINESADCIKKAQTKKKVYQTAGVTWTSYYTNNQTNEEPLNFVITAMPESLIKLDLIWMLVLQAGNADVASKSIEFLIQIYTQLDETITASRGEISQQLIAKCFELLKQEGDGQYVTRILMVLKSMIKIAEKKGTGDIQPHSAILKGEVLERIIIKNSTRVNAPNLVVKVLTSATVWEFVDKVSRMCELAPQFVEVKLSNGVQISQSDYGKTLGEMGLRNHDIVTVRRNTYDHDPQFELLIDPETNKLSQKASKVFSDLYDKFSNKDGVMTPESTTRFIVAVIGEICGPTDYRIKGLFDKYDANNDGVLERDEFKQFYEDACKEKPNTVYENLKNMFVGCDLVRLCDIYEESYFNQDEMPRRTLSHNQLQFDVLMRLLDKNDDSTSKVWQLIRMLETNQKIYERVLNMQIWDNQQNIQLQDQAAFWPLFFESGNPMQRAYTHEIIESLMEDGQDLTNRVFFVEFQNQSEAYNEHLIPKVRSRKGNEANQLLKQSWTSKFLEHGGLQYVLNGFFAKCNEASQEVKFLLSILTVYVQGAITAAQLQSSASQETSDFVVVKMLELLSKGNSILSEISFERLQSCLIQLVQTILLKNECSITDKHIVANALTLWKCSLFYQPDLFAVFLNTPNVDEFVMSGILYCTEENIRQNFQSCLLDLAQNLTTTSESALAFLLRLLSKHFNQISKYYCRQFFELFNKLIDLHFIKVVLGSAEEDLFNAEELLGLIIDKIRADNSTKKITAVDDLAAQEQAAEKERLMVGLVLLTQKIISKVDTKLSEKIVKDKDLINEIFKEFLFSSVFSSDSQTTAETENMLDLIKNRAPRKMSLPAASGKPANRSREAAYNLLSELIKKSPVIMNNFVRDQLRPLLEIIKKPKTWNYMPPSSSGRVQKYVGLKNLGCICYMNSMMQQFFMIPAFRYNLLCVDDGLPENIKEYKSEQIDDNMLHQIQRLFAHLELSERSDYNPIGFTFSFKEFDGTPTNTAEQKDAQEFLNVLFDRLENALKPTPRKYLLQSVFGGKTCSQLICPECGKVKNRIEDYYNMSLTVKDINSVYDSLAKQIEGEVISDFECDGCKKKVDITKRTLIAETPNVLIVHLQRILFNFDTFQNDKLNQHFEFPTHLDLKPYSYYEVMKREHRVPDEKGDDDEEQKEVEQTEDNQQPNQEDCFEYKLVGVNVHSGSANAGHYWSYINTARGFDEKDPSDPTWADTDKEPWQEFNDSQVKDYKFENLTEECFGDKPGSQASSWGYGGKYGKSGYMLFYERRVKKPIKIVVDEEQAKSCTNVLFEEKTKEWIKQIAYSQGVDQEKPNKIFQQVLEDNTKFSFENDIYSLEFFDFIRQILQNVAAFGNSQDEVNKEMRVHSIAVARRAAFDILARCYYNNGIRDLILVMIQIFEQDDSLVIDFTEAMLDCNQGEPMLEMVLDCMDSSARTAVGDLMRYLICKVKLIEKNKLQGEQHRRTASANFLQVLAQNLHVRAAKAWSRFEKYLELFSAFALESPQEVIDAFSNVVGVNKMVEDPEAQQIGLEYFFKINMLSTICDFILGDKSPNASQTMRVQMGGTYQQPNFQPLIKVISKMIGSKSLIAKYPLTPEVAAMLTNKIILGKILEDNAVNQDFGEMLSGMCLDNPLTTRKIAKIFIKGINQNSVEKIQVYLPALQKFLLIKDSLQQQRLEYILGVAQLKTEHAFRSISYKYGVEVVDRINDKACDYISALSKTFSPSVDQSLLERIIAQKGRVDDFCIKALNELMQMCILDSAIAKYVFQIQPYSFQFARYCDWFKDYIETQKEENEKNAANGYSYYKQRAESAAQCYQVYLKFQAIIDQFQTSDLQSIQAAMSANEVLQKQWMPSHSEVIQHWPPQYLIGKQTEEEKKLLSAFEDDYVVVQLFEVQCEWMYSNPTGVFNLSLPDKLNRCKNYTHISYQQFKDFQAKEADMEPTQAETKSWLDDHSKGAVLLQVLVTSKQQSSLQVKVTVSNPETTNVYLPVSQIRDTVFSNDKKVFAHFMKIRPQEPWGGQFAILVEHSSQKQAEPPKLELVSTGVGNSAISEQVEYECSSCGAAATVDQDFCTQCNEPLNEESYNTNSYGVWQQ